MGGSPSRERDPKNIVLLCRTHHEEVTTGGYVDGVVEIGGTRTYWRKDRKGETVFERDISVDIPETGSDTEPGSGEVDIPQDIGEAETVALEPKEDDAGETSASPYQLMSLTLHRETTFEEWVGYGETLRDMIQFMPWAIGDWINFGEDHHSDKYTQAMDTLGIDYSRLANYASVAKRVPSIRRMKELSWSHHATVAMMEPEMQTNILRWADYEKMPVAELRKRINPNALSVKRYTIAELNLCGKCKARLEVLK
jgi:hypothetical protein